MRSGANCNLPHKTAYLVTPMRENHVPQIAAIERETFSLPWDEASIRGELNNPLALWLVAEDAKGAAAESAAGGRAAGTVLGYVGSQTVFEDADILNVAVLPAARRRGIAGALMRELERLLIPKGVGQITLEVRASNLPAIRLYEKLGYAQVGLRRNYYEKPREDALILQKKLVLE